MVGKKVKGRIKNKKTWGLERRGKDSGESKKDFSYVWDKNRGRRSGKGSQEGPELKCSAREKGNYSEHSRTLNK